MLYLQSQNKQAGLPDPPSFTEELTLKRAEERDFLVQLLDGSKVADYEMPIKVAVQLRKYQQEGVNWLAFLAKYQLHGILCDDMGLGKTLQTICILASNTHERAQRHAATRSPDTLRLPSLVLLLVIGNFETVTTVFCLLSEDGMPCRQQEPSRSRLTWDELPTHTHHRHKQESLQLT